MDTFNSWAMVGKAAKYISVEKGPIPCKAPNNKMIFCSCFFVMKNGLKPMRFLNQASTKPHRFEDWFKAKMTNYWNSANFQQLVKKWLGEIRFMLCRINQIVMISNFYTRSITTA